MAKPTPNYDLLNQVQYWATDPNSPLLKQVKSDPRLMALEKQASGLDEKSPEFKKIAQQYQQLAASQLLGHIQKQFGGAVPAQGDAEKFDLARRAEAQGGGDAADVISAKSVQKPYANAYAVLQQLQQASGGPTPASVTEPGAPTKLGPGPRPAPHPVRPALPPDATDDQKLTDAQLGVLYGLAQTGKPQGDPGNLYDVDARDTSASLPQTSATGPAAVPGAAPVTADMPPEQQQMQAYKQAFADQQNGVGAHASLPLPPGWARSPAGVPITAPGEDTVMGKTREQVEEEIRQNMLRMMQQERK